MHQLTEKKRKSNKLISLTARVLSILSIFAIGKLDHVYADSGFTNGQQKDDRGSDTGGDIAYISAGDADIEGQWGGGGEPPRPE